MPEKLSPYRSYGQKLISLFARLLFSGEKHSLIGLSQMLGCSKQTVLRLVEDIRMSYDVDIEETMKETRRYYRIKTAGRTPPALPLTDMEINVLLMCRAFAENLLGVKFFNEAAMALEKSRVLLPQNKALSFHHFTSFKPGSIDYTPYEDSIRRILQAMEEKRICKIAYKSITAKRAKIFYIMPLKIFSHHDTIYLSARLATKPGRPYQTPLFDPLLAIHRTKKVELTDRPFEFPRDYNFEKTFNQNFGIIKEDAFEVEVEFKGYAANYVSERIWSPDQKIIKKGKGKVRLILNASSDPELITWLLSFGDEARLLKPEYLQKKIKNIANKIQDYYT